MTRPPLDYQSALRPDGQRDPPKAGSVLMYCSGLAAGLAMSAVVWTAVYWLIGISGVAFGITAADVITAKKVLATYVERKTLATGFAPGMFSSIAVALLLGLFAVPILLCGVGRI